MVFPVHAARRLGLGRAAASGAHRRYMAGPASQAAPAREPERVLLRAGSHERRATAGGGVREKPDLGPRDWKRRTTGAQPGQEPTPTGTKVCPAVEGATNWFSTAFSPATGLYYVQTLESCSIYTQAPDTWRAGGRYYAGSTRQPRESAAEVCVRSRFRWCDCLGTAADRPRQLVGWRAGERRRPRLLRRGQRGAHGSRRHDGRAALAIPDECDLESVTDDLRLRWPPAHRGCSGSEHPRLRAARVATLHMPPGDAALRRAHPVTTRASARTSSRGLSTRSMRRRARRCASEHARIRRSLRQEERGGPITDSWPASTPALNMMSPVMNSERGRPSSRSARRSPCRAAARTRTPARCAMVATRT